MPLLAKTAQILGQPPERMFALMGEPTTVEGLPGSPVCVYVNPLADGYVHTLRVMCGTPLVQIATLELAFPSENEAVEMRQQVGDRFRSNYGAPRMDGGGPVWEIGASKVWVMDSENPAAFMLFFSVN